MAEASTSMLLHSALAQIATEIDDEFGMLLASPGDARDPLYAAMRHAAIGGGKRLRLLLLTALTVCDELFEMREKLADAEARAKPMDQETVGGATRVIEAAANRIDGMNERLSA